MITKAQKFEYVQLEDYEGLIDKIRLVSKDLKDCHSDIEDLQRLENEKHRETNIAKKIVIDIKKYIQELNSMFMKDLFDAEKAGYKDIDTSTKARKITKPIKNEDALANLRKNLDSLREQLDKI